LLCGFILNNEQLWAPWRIGYITGDKGVSPPQADQVLEWQPDADRSCFLCRAVAESSADADRRNLVVCRTSDAIAVLNRYPYNNGHLLIAPLRHIPRLNELTAGEQSSLMHLVTKSCSILEQTMNAEGFNVGLNLGRIAGAGVPGHLHWHVVPRWSGDTNFMPVSAGVNVIPQALDAAFELLHKALNSTL
jgi:ATP adenylyltransferase